MKRLNQYSYNQLDSQLTPGEVSLVTLKGPMCQPQSSVLLKNRLNAGPTETRVGCVMCKSCMQCISMILP